MRIYLKIELEIDFVGRILRQPQKIYHILSFSPTPKGLKDSTILRKETRFFAMCIFDDPSRAFQHSLISDRNFELVS